MKTLSLSIFKLGLVISAGILASILFTKPINAQYYSQSNGVPSIVVDKKIRPINDEVFYDNIDPTVKVFGEGEQIEFKITVSNNSNQDLYNVEVKDSLPKYFSLLYYPGVYNMSEGFVSKVIDHLKVGESVDYFIRLSVNQVPLTNLAYKNIMQINKVCASNDLVSDCDQVQYFVGAKNVPTTGAGDLESKTVMVLLITFSALAFRKLARGY